MYLAIAGVLFVIWVVSFLMFHIAGGLLHLLVIFAVISLILHLFRGRSASA